MNGSGFRTRLVLSMAIVVLSGGIAAWIVGQAVGPELFRVHLERAEHGPGSVETHAREAFVSASALTLAAALGASVLTSLVLAYLVSRRVAVSLAGMAAVSAQVAAGRFDERVAAGPATGAEFEELAAAINGMAGRLGENEATRRRLTADVAHELRTPVATIAGYLDAIDDGVAELNPATTATLREQTSRLTRLVADLTAVTQAESGATRLDLRPADPARLIEAAATAAGARCTAGQVRLLTHADPALPPVAVDHDRFGQVLANLLDNALRHTPPGGEVRLAARRAGPAVRFTVTDSGDGIAAEHLPHLFDRFYRTDAARDRDHGGSGIGLAIVKALAEAHGGTVAAASDGPSRGATFAITLPATARPWHARRPGAA
ncbi:sensor histidine kinase [Myceligenerans crystallogenes]|uniref:histidine kinase n=1 Tax=Myceligenerans crystallogenes TaxID=316335 RepID=A0ABN2NH85_9MICO